jgi:hypothetical protein
MVRLVDLASLKHIKPRQHQLAKANRTHLDVSQKSSLSETYFFLAVFFFAFFAFAFFAFLAMLPSVVPCFNAGRSSTCMKTAYTTFAKLISRASNKVNDRHAVVLFRAQKSLLAKR